MPEDSRQKAGFTPEDWDKLKYGTRSIEIKFRTDDSDPGILTRVFFPWDPDVCPSSKLYLIFTILQKQLSEEEKEIVKSKIDRESPKDKVKDLLRWTGAIKKKISHRVCHII